tara:strand:+ start:177 stop:515 length:339 start_codon:yes stop_codon:yes gene_type:complete
MTTVDHIALRVHDLNKAREWYEENLNAKVVFNSEFYVRMSLNNTTLALIDEQRYLHNHIGILVENIDNLPKNGQRIEHRDGTVGVYVRDPFGNVIEYIWYSEEAKRKVNGET